MTQAQRVLEIRDHGQFAIDFVTGRGAPNMDSGNQDFSAGVNLGASDGNDVSGPYIRGGYLQTTDTYLFLMNQDKQLGSGIRAFYGGVYAMDALTQDPTRGWWVPLRYVVSATGSFTFYGGALINKFIVGQPNMGSLSQRFYFYQGGWHAFNARDSSIVQVNIWPNIGVDLLINGAVDGTTPGFWSLDLASSSSNRGAAVAFEGITDTSFGMPGETLEGTGMIRGGTSHPKGLLLTRANRHNFLGNGTGNNIKDQHWLWVDLDTGLAVGVLGVYARADSDTKETWQEPSVDKRDGFFWDTVQFVPDPESSFERPKGELHFMLCSQSLYTRSGESVEDPLGTSFNPTTSVVEYFAVYDFNPFNQTTGVQRTHNRRTQTGAVHLPVAPLVPGGSVSITTSPAGTRGVGISPMVFYHPPSRSYVNIQNSYAAGTNNGVSQPDAGSHRTIRWARDNRDDAVSVPVPDSAVIENGASYIDIYVTTELNEPTPNHVVYFQTVRRSTRAESFDGTAQGASPYVVDRGVIDQDGFLDVRHTNDVDGAGTLLAETTDYTVNYGTGTLTPVGSWPAQTIFVRYRHRSAPVSPGFGTLSAASAATDENGKATAIILLPDSLDGELLGLDVSTEAPF